MDEELVQNDVMDEELVQKIVMDEELVQNGVMNETSVKNFVMDAKIGSEGCDGSVHVQNWWTEQFATHWSTFVGRICL